MDSITKYCVCLIVAFGAVSMPALKSQTFVKTRPYFVQKYYKDKHAPGFKICYISSPFAKSTLEKGVKIPELNNHRILGIDYYYTQYKSARKFQQVGLDEDRFKQLKKDYPLIYNLVDSVPVRFIEQVLATTKVEA